MDIIIAMVLEAIISVKAPAPAAVLGGCITLGGAALAMQSNVAGEKMTLSFRFLRFDKQKNVFPFALYFGTVLMQQETQLRVACCAWWQQRSILSLQS